MGLKTSYVSFEKITLLGKQTHGGGIEIFDDV